MLNSFSRPASWSRRRPEENFLLLSGAVFGLCLMQTPVRAQSDVGVGDAGACTLKDHVYTCNKAEFQKALAAAATMSIETHNADGVARAELTSLVTKKLNKTIAPTGTPADLDFLLFPVEDSGEITYFSGSVARGTLRVYSVAANGTRGHLLWAETYSGLQDTPWPIVVHGLILVFQSQLHIK
jgi:hypothetical protein